MFVFFGVFRLGSPPKKAAKNCSFLARIKVWQYQSPGGYNIIAPVASVSEKQRRDHENNMFWGDQMMQMNGNDVRFPINSALFGLVI